MWPGLEASGSPGEQTWPVALRRGFGSTLSPGHTRFDLRSSKLEPANRRPNLQLWRPRGAEHLAHHVSKQKLGAHAQIDVRALLSDAGVIQQINDEMRRGLLEATGRLGFRRT